MVGLFGLLFFFFNSAARKYQNDNQSIKSLKWVKFVHYNILKKSGDTHIKRARDIPIPGT